MSDITGFALRRNESCLNTEKYCGNTHDDMKVCCPGSMECTDDPLYGNSVCCEKGGSCDEKAGPNKCASNDAYLYTSVDGNMTSGGFCCSKDEYAFKLSENDYVGCLDSQTEGSETGTVWLVATPTSSPTKSPTCT